MIKSWVFEFNGAQGRTEPDYSDEDFVQQAFDTNLGRVVSLEALGFEGVFFSEHHFVHSFAPSPHLLIANIAARTNTLKLGVMGTVLAFHHPWRVAEEFGMLDYLTHGRLEIGVAAGVPPEFLFVNIPQDQVRALYEDGIAFLDEALASRSVTIKGRHWDYEDVPVTPHVKQVGRRRKWMAVYTGNSCRMAARRQYRVCTGFQSVENAAKAFDAYREEADKVGFEVTADDVAIRRTVFIAETDAEANERFQELLPLQQKRLVDSFAPANERLMKVLGQGPAAGVLATGTKDATGLGSGDVKKADPGDIVSVKDEFIFGSPKTVADKIIAQCRRLGAGHVVGVHLATLTDEELDANYKLWAEVIPILRKAEVARNPVEAELT